MQDLKRTKTTTIIGISYRIINVSQRRPENISAERQGSKQIWIDYYHKTPNDTRKADQCHHHVTLLAWVSLTLSLSLSLCLYHPSLPVSLLDNIMCPYWVVIGKILLVNQHLHVRVKGFIGELRLWVSPYFSNSVLHVLSVLFGWF